jgi:non-ribosomal peptide synthase protein (TIGR01720 family)
MAERAFRYEDLSGIKEEEERARRIEEIGEREQKRLDIERGSLMRVIYFNLGEGRGGRLLLIIHHLVVDGVSWRILLEDLQNAYEQLKRGLHLSFPPKTTSFMSWAHKLRHFAHSQQIIDESPYWQQVEHHLSQQQPLPVDKLWQQQSSTRKVVIRALSQEQTRRLLSEAGAAYHTQIQELLLTALVEAVWKWSGQRQLVVQMEGHGREELFEDVDLTRTVGWFTTLYPLLLDLRKVHGVGEAVKTVKEQVRAVPGKGIGYGIWKYLSNKQSEGEVQAREAEISFNYLGQFDQVLSSEEGMLKGAGESSGRAQSAEADREQKIEVIGSVAGGRLQVGWSYREEEYEQETIERIAEEYMKELEQIVEHCVEEEAGGWTPSDFPLANLDQQDLNKVFEQLSEEA